jgi:hypothetical protein
VSGELPVTASRPLRAPRADGAIVARPPLDQAGRLLDGNQQRRRGTDLPILGWRLSALRQAARFELLAQAKAYHCEAGEPIPEASPDAIVMAGHQPELFHPGVWVKNFALAGMAQHRHVTAVNLIVDNDTLKSAELRLPALSTGGAPWPHIASLRFDRRAAEVPYEEAVVHDEDLFRSVAARATGVTADWNCTPLLAQFWAEALAAADHTPLVGERFVRARRSLERSWGCHNLEVPASRLCRTEPFAVFVGHILGELPRFHGLYNEVVHDYRRRHGLRSRSHPVPDLAAEDDWREAPFWAWRTGENRRGRLMVRPGDGVLQLRVGGQRWPDLSADASRLPRALLDLERQGFKVRQRALTNTLFARLLLCDLFVHGIGGALYDELTDELLRRFYGVAPPEYLVLSATLLLPLPCHPVTVEEERRLARRLRDLHWNPQRHLKGNALVNEHAEWVAFQPRTRAERRERCRRLRDLVESLRPAVQEQIEQTRQQLELCRRQVEANAILRRRDYAFCLYPESLLRPFCTRFLRSISD